VAGDCLDSNWISQLYKQHYPYTGSEYDRYILSDTGVKAQYLASALQAGSKIDPANYRSSYQLSYAISVFSPGYRRGYYCRAAAC